MSESRSSSSPLSIFVGIAFKILTSITIIPINKYIYSRYGFPNMALTCIHFAVTFAGVLVLNRLGVFETKRVPLMRMLPMAVSFCGFVALNNLSLELNTIGVSQHLKVLTMPTVMVLSYALYDTVYSRRVKIAIFFVVSGIYINSYYDVKFNLVGVFLGLLGVVTTSVYQIWIGEKQKEFAVSALQLLFYQAPLSALVLVLIMPLFESSDKIASLFDGSRSIAEWAVVMLSGLIAFLFNWSVYWIIGSTSALTYNIIGNLKFIVVIAIGIVLFDDVPNAQQVFAVVLVFAGLICYSVFRVRETAAACKVAGVSPPTVEKKES